MDSGSDEVRVFRKDVAYLLRHLLVDLHPSRYENQFRAQLACTGRCHGRADAKLACLIACRRHNTPFFFASYGNRFATQLRVVALFNGGIEGVHVDVDDFA